MYSIHKALDVLITSTADVYSDAATRKILDPVKLYHPFQDCTDALIDEKGEAFWRKSCIVEFLQSEA